MAKYQVRTKPKNDRKRPKVGTTQIYYGYGMGERKRPAKYKLRLDTPSKCCAF